MGSLARLNHFFWDYRRLFIPGLLCAVAAAVFRVTVPMVVREAVDSVPRIVSLYHLYGGTPLEAPLYGYFFGALLFFGGLVIVLSLVSGLFTFAMRQTVVVASRHVEYDLRNELFEKLQSLSARFYADYTTGDVMTRATSDIEQVRRYIGPAVMYAVQAFVTTAAVTAAMLAISPSLTLWALAPMPLLAVSIFFVARMVFVRSDAQQQQYSTLTSRVQEALSGIRVLKAYTREAAEADAFDRESEGYRRRVLSLALVDALWRPVMLVLIGLSTILVVGIGGRQVIAGVITIGNIAEFIIYVALLTWPVASIGFILSMIQRAAASQRRLNAILDTEPAVQDGPQTDASVTAIRGGIAFEGVSYRYEAEGPDVLCDVSFSVGAGSTLAVVGRTGAGKSTLVEMIPRLVDPSRGTVRIDGHDVRTIPLDVLRQNIGYVPQEVFLFSDTVAHNIAFGRLDAEQADIEDAAAEAELLGNIQDFPMGFETFVGERGITLSGGQKQRASIARALIRDPAILILDDALSAVDTGTERAILGHLRRHYGRRTIVIVSHRISAVQAADLILVLDEGRITERGTHDELVLADGLYAAMYRKQLLEEEIEAL